MPAQTDTLLRYRPWRGTLHGPLWSALAMARASLKLMFRRRLYWGLFALSLMVFFFFFYGQYLVVWITTQLVGWPRAGRASHGPLDRARGARHVGPLSQSQGPLRVAMTGRDDPEETLACGAILLAADRQGADVDRGRSNGSRRTVPSPGAGGAPGDRTPAGRTQLVPEFPEQTALIERRVQRPG